MEAISTFHETISVETSLTQLLKTKDLETDAHSSRVASLTSEWFHHMRSRREQGWVTLDEHDLVLAARLHDVGKVGVLDRVLKKEGKLTELEREHLNQHAELGFELVKDMSGAQDLALAVRHHHERWDGGGYPAGLRENQIPFFAQIISICDAFDAMTSNRCYQRSRSELQAIEELENNAGSQFSPQLVVSFVKFLHARQT